MSSIEYKKKIPQGFWGMNYYAAKKHIHIPFNHKSKKTVEVLKSMNKSLRRRTIKHEKIEAALMKRGHQYRTAHELALKYEASKLPLSKIVKLCKEYYN